MPSSLSETGRTRRAPKGGDALILKARSASEIETAFATFVPLHAGALAVSADPFLTSRREQLVSWHRAMPFRRYMRGASSLAAGGLSSYGSSPTAAFRLVGIYAGKILEGWQAGRSAGPTADQLELVVNLNTAKALGLTLPPSILARADEVIQ